MTANEFRAIARSLPSVVELQHNGIPDFRVNNKIFATLGAPDVHHGMVKLTVEQQAEYYELTDGALYPVPGYWGKHGATFVVLERVRVETAEQFLRAAWTTLCEGKKNSVKTPHKIAEKKRTAKSKKGGTQSKRAGAAKAVKKSSNSDRRKSGRKPST